MNSITYVLIERHWVAAYDELLRRYGAVESAKVRAQCAMALVNKGVTLGEQMGDPQGEVAVYDEVVERYGNMESAEVQAQCARALVNKGWALANKLNNPDGAVALFDEVMQRYGDSRDQAVQAKCLSALSNSAELLLTLGRYEAAIERMRQVLARVGPADQKSAIMPFLLWLAEADTTLADVLAAISALEPEVQFTWGFDEVRPMIDELPEPRRAQARCLVAFFEQHHDMARLKACLQGIDGRVA